jgi:hypothetical protein
MRNREAVDELTGRFHELRPGDAPVVERLSTSERVLRRVTDGIYREPASALRELISNAYDADAGRVEITTDAPVFSEIVIRDDGNGFSERGLANLIKSIGGSAKRTAAGAEAGITQKQDPTKSPNGRRLIGKIGIGLFAVSQLTRTFQVVTKRKGDPFRLLAEVVLETNSEDDLITNADGEFQTGSVSVSKEHATDEDAQGTQIVLHDLKRFTIDALRGVEEWRSVFPGDLGLDDSVKPKLPPKYHIGFVDDDEDCLLRVPPELPWPPESQHTERFRHMVDKVWLELGSSRGSQKPQLCSIFGSYFRLLWTLALQAPVDYIDGHPFDIVGGDGVRAFELGDPYADSATAEELELGPSESIRDRMGLRSPERGKVTDFSVYVDGIELLRPIRFRGLPKFKHAISTPLLFAGHAHPPLDSFPPEIRGGELVFEAYLFWNPRVAPNDHNGVQIRINDASGMLFDSTFMKYNISELTRKSQIVAEVFVLKGADAALNIDRESLNVAHPHYQLISIWLHGAMRQLMTRHKALSAAIRKQAREAQMDDLRSEFDREVDTAVERSRSDTTDPPSVFELLEDPEEVSQRRKEGDVAYQRGVVLSPYPSPARVGSRKAQDEELFEKEICAIARILEAFGLLEALSYERQEQLLKEIANVLCIRRREGSGK